MNRATFHFLYTVLVSFPVFLHAQLSLTGTLDISKNHRVTTTYLLPFDEVPSHPNIGEAVRQVHYFDGLGRTTQVIGLKASPRHYDAVSFAVYDSVGRASKQYLPYTTAVAAGGGFKTNA